MGVAITIEIHPDLRPLILERRFSTFSLLRPDIIGASFDYGADVYEKKFGVESGKYLYVLSVLKNNGIITRQPNLSRIWDQARRAVLQAPVGIWIKDDSQPKRL